MEAALEHDPVVVRAALERRLALPRLYGRLFPAQRAYRDDKSRRKAALCTRRAGKTEGTATTLIDDAVDYPGTASLYLALTHKSAKRIIWPIIKRLIAGRTDVRPNETDLTLTFDNGSVIYIGGAETDADVEKYRGWKLRRVVVDEAASFGNRLRYIIEEVLEPALFDLLGDLELIGTPSASCVGFFHDVTMGLVPGWSVHKWSVLDNPHIPHAKAELERMMKERKWDESHPVLLREWRGRWVRDESSLVYGRFSRAGNVYTELPKKIRTWSHVLGIDIGYDDPVAFGIASFAYDHPNIYLHGGWHRSGMTVSELAAKAIEYIEAWKPIRIKMDTGGLGKMIAAEITVRHNIPIEAAEKSEKPAIIELLNSDFKAGKALVKEGDPAIDEYETIQWDPKRVGKEDEQYPNDLSDAKLYAYREARHWTFKAKPALPAKGTPERATLDAEKAFEAAVARVKRGKHRPYGV
jgi:hypothetical protein